MERTRASVATERARAAAADEALCTVLGVIGEPMNGVSYVRFHQPFRRLRDDGFELRTLGASLNLTPGTEGYEPHPSLLDGVSLLVFPQMVLSPVLPDGSPVQIVGPLCREARRRGIPIVYSVDDYLSAIEKQNPNYETIRGAEDNLRTLLDHAAAFIVTTEPLRRSLSRSGVPVHVLPNAVDPNDWTMRPRSSGELRVGWTGSSTHLDDMLMVLPAIERLQRRRDFLFVVQGLTDLPLDEQVKQIERNRVRFSATQRETAERFIAVERRLRDTRHRHIPFGPTEAFFDLLPTLDLDLGICPLLDTPFNRHKSANKFYEYAITGTMTVASDVTPYKEEGSVTVSNAPDEWVEILEHYLGDEEARDAALADQREYVLAERNIEQTRADWAAALREIANPTRNA